MSLASYRELEAWQRAMALVEACYALTAAFPVEERFNLCTQIRRAAVSIPANIAEGHQRPIGQLLHGLSRSLQRVRS